MSARNVTNPAEAADMTVLDSASISVPAEARAGPVPAETSERPGLAAGGRAALPAARPEVPFDRVTRLVAMVLGTPLASVIVAGGRPSSRKICPGAPGPADRQSPAEQSLCQYVIDSEDKLVLDDARLDPRAIAGYPLEWVSVSAWAGFPARAPERRVVGGLRVD